MAKNRAWRVKENALRLQAARGWRIVQNRAAFSGWCPQQESNLHLPLRRGPFYPLNYGDTRISYRHKYILSFDFAQDDTLLDLQHIDIPRLRRK